MKPAHEQYEELAEAADAFRAALRAEVEPVLEPVARWLLGLYYRGYARVVQFVASCNVPR